jgi:hypothetical protein
MNTFNKLNPTSSYLIVDGETGYSLTDGIQGSDAMAMDWPAGAEAWNTGETKFMGSPVDKAS